MFCNVKIKFVFLFKGIKVMMIGVCFKVQTTSNYNMNIIFKILNRVIFESLI